MLQPEGQVTAAEIGRRLGVTRATVSNWKRRHSDFPAPVGGSKASPLYVWDAVAAWANFGSRGLRTDEPDDQLVEEDRAHLLKVDPMTGLTEFERRKCEHCGGVHPRECMRVKRKVERITPDGGRTIEVEYWPQGEWENAYVIWPEMLGIVDPREVGG